MMLAYLEPFAKLWGCGRRNSRHHVQHRDRPLVALDNHGAPQSNFRLAAGVRLRHVCRTTHLRHTFAAFALLGCHRPLWHHARYQWSGGPIERQERKRDSRRTTHVLSLGWPHLQAQVILVTGRSDPRPAATGKVVEAPEQLATAFGGQRVVGGIAVMLGRIVAPGHIRNTLPQTSISIGELDGGSSQRLVRLQEAFTRAGVTARIVPDIVSERSPCLTTHRRKPLVIYATSWMATLRVRNGDRYNGAVCKGRRHRGPASRLSVCRSPAAGMQDSRGNSVPGRRKR